MANRYPLIVTNAGIVGDTSPYAVKEIPNGDDLRLDGTGTNYNAIRVGTASGGTATILKDTNGNEVLNLLTTGAAVTYVQFQNNTTTNPPIISAAGETNTSLRLQGTGTGNIQLRAATTEVGSAAAAAVVQSSGNFDLILKTGNASTGNITITQGANADITIDPNGTGKVLIGDATTNSTLLINGNTATGTATLETNATNGTVTLFSSTDTHTINLGVGVNASTKTKTLNLGTAGASGSQTNINIGSSTSGSHSSIILQSGRGRITTSNTQTVSIATSSIATSAGTVTITFANQNLAPFEVGSLITVSGVVPAGYNGTYNVTACTATTVSYANATTGAQTTAGTVSGETGGIRIAALSQGLAAAGNAPIKFTKGTILTAVEAGAVEYDGTTVFMTPSASYGRAAVPLSIYTSGTGTSGITATTNYALFPAANDTVTLPVGVYRVLLSFKVTVAGSTVASVLNLNIRGAGTAAGSFTWNGVGSITAAGAATLYENDNISLGTVMNVAPSSNVNGRVYQVWGEGLLKVTTAGTIIPAYQFPSTLTSGTVTLSSANYMVIQTLDTVGSNTAGPNGRGWG